MPGFCWSDVIQIEVYKLDVMIYDEVALQFNTTSGRYEILEGHTAFQGLLDQLQEQFEIPVSWYSPSD